MLERRLTAIPQIVLLFATTMGGCSSTVPEAAKDGGITGGAGSFVTSMAGNGTRATGGTESTASTPMGGMSSSGGAPSSTSSIEFGSGGLTTNSLPTAGSSALLVASGGTTVAGAGRGNRGGSTGAGSTGTAKATGGTANGNAGAGGRTSGGASIGGNSSGKATGGTSTSIAGSGGCHDGPALTVPDGYQLVWADEFNVDGRPDPNNWGYETGFVRNEEAQWYQSDNAWVDKGCLVIEGRRERKTNPNYKAGSSDWKTNRQYAEYTSSSLRTMGLQSWQFGRFEMRGRIKPQTGLWPAWWTLGVAKEWPSCGEIDIMEYYAGMIRANVACGTSTRWQAKWDGAAWEVATFDDKNWANGFHIWRMDWDDSKIDLLLDDKLVNTAKLSDMLNPDGSSPFRQKHYMLVNLAIGGANGGDPAKTTFPTRYEVDYVRVFQRQ